MTALLRPADDDVTWFGASHRLIAGRPDTRYGWLQTPSGPGIVKALDLELAAYSAALLDNERSVLRHLQAAGAPVPELLACERGDWLVTRFAGLSHRSLRLGAHAAERFPFDERLAAWVHFLRRARHFDEAGALPIDLWGANLVLPLTQGTSGQLRLHQAVAIDHAHTVVAGMNMRRPVWMDRAMRRVPPELRAALHDDQEALIAAFRSAGAALPGHAEADAAAHDLTRRLWAEYDAPQQLQRTLDNGRLDRGAAMQFAVAVELEQLSRSAPACSAPAVKAVLLRMKADAPGARFASLAEAAQALQEAALPSLPMVGHWHFPEIGPANLLGAEGPVDPAKTGTFLRRAAPVAEQARRPYAATTLVLAATLPPVIAAPEPVPIAPTAAPPVASPVADRRTLSSARPAPSSPPRLTLGELALPMRWIYALVAAGALAGAWSPWPW